MKRSQPKLGNIIGLSPPALAAYMQAGPGTRADVGSILGQVVGACGTAGIPADDGSASFLADLATGRPVSVRSDSVELTLRLGSGPMIRVTDLYLTG